MILSILGITLRIEALLLIIPFLVGLIYKESASTSFLFTALLCIFISILSHFIKVERKRIYAREGFLITALVWIVVSAFGAIPLVLSGSIPHYIDALFEIVSGFTTTGASILTSVEDLPKCILFWRSFTHWVGGMGVLVFILSIIPLQGNDYNMHIMRAESPGPIIGKLVPKLKHSASLLYGIYTVLTLLCIICLVIAGMPLFDSICHAFGTAGTGGFGILNSGIATYNNPLFEVIITIFMILFGINFNVYFFLMIWDVKSIFKSEEMRGYLGVIAVAIGLITLNLWSYYGSILEALRHASFQVASIITTTGYASYDFTLWPQFSQTVLLLLMFVGACAGSTGGGIKISRYIIMLRKIKNTIIKQLHPRSVKIVTLEGKQVSDDTVTECFVFFILYILIFGVCFLIVSLDGFDMESTFTAVATCLGNVGPAFGIFGPMSNYSTLSVLSKIVLTIAMLFGRLEIFPMLMAMIPAVYNSKKSSNF